MTGRRLVGPASRADERLDDLADAHHETNLVARHANDVAAGVRSDLDGLRPTIDELVRRTDGEQQKLDVLHDHEQRLQRIERRQAIDTFTRWIVHQTVPDDLTISIVVPTRNRAHCLPEAIASVRAQTYERWEVVVVDDGSTDGTADLLDELTTDPRIRAFRTGGAARGAGACAARNRGLDELRGDVVVYLDDDNRLDEQWLKAVAWCFGSRPGLTWLYGARIIDDLQKIVTGEPGGVPEIEFEPFDRSRLEQGSFIDTGVLAHRADADVRYVADIWWFGDWDLALQLSALAPPVELPAVATYYATDQPDRLSGPRDSHFLPGASAEAERVRRRHASRVAGSGACPPPADPDR